VSPLTTALMRGTERRALVLVVIADAVGPRPERAHAWRQAFGLSEAESRVALGLVEGLAPAGIAARHGVSLPTARSQIRSLMAKTGTRRQPELLLALARVAHDWTRLRGRFISFDEAEDLTAVAEVPGTCGLPATQPPEPALFAAAGIRLAAGRAGTHFGESGDA